MAFGVRGSLWDLPAAQVESGMVTLSWFGMKFSPATTAAVVYTWAPPAKTSSDLLHRAIARRGIAVFMLCSLAGLPPSSSACAVSTDFPLPFAKKRGTFNNLRRSRQAMVASGRRHPYRAEAIEATDVACDGACFGISYDLDSDSTR